MEAISLKCPHCGAVLTVPDTYVGRTSRCGRCRHDVFIKPHRDAPGVQTGRRARPSRWYSALTIVVFAALVLVLIEVIATYVL